MRTPRTVIEEPTPSVRPTPVLLRLLMALPHLAALGFLVVVFADYIGGEIRITERVRNACGWLGYELLACVYASVLPLGMVLIGIGRAIFNRPAGQGRSDGSLLLLLPFLWIAWSMSPEDTPRWGVLAFLALALARWLPHRHERTLVREGLLGVAGGAYRAVIVWGFFTASFLLSAFLILPLEPLLGLEMPTVEHGQYFMFLGIGIVYFLLTVVFEVFDLTKKLFPPHKRLRNPFRGVLRNVASEPTLGQTSRSE